VQCNLLDVVNAVCKIDVAKAIYCCPSDELIVNWYDIKVSAQPFEAAIR